MKYRALGATGIEVSELSFGAGPVAGLMTGTTARRQQRATLRRALAAGINWFDTAATYGDGVSESNLGAGLREVGAPRNAHIATKVRLASEQLGRIKESVRTSVAASLRRLGCERLTLIQLHNAITRNRGDLPTSITARDVLGRDGVLAAFEALKSDGLVAHIGLTALGDMPALLEVVRAGTWQTIQTCHNILHPRVRRADKASASSAAVVPQRPMLFEAICETVAPAASAESEREDLIAVCARRKIGVIAIRVLAGGALAGQPPSAHTLRTRFFPLEVYQRDEEQAARLAKLIPPPLSLKEVAVRYVLSDPDVSTALIGFADPAQIDEVVRFANAGALPLELRASLAIVEAQTDDH